MTTNLLQVNQSVAKRGDSILMQIILFFLYPPAACAHRICNLSSVDLVFLCHRSPTWLIFRHHENVSKEVQLMLPYSVKRLGVILWICTFITQSMCVMSSMICNRMWQKHFFLVFQCGALQTSTENRFTGSVSPIWIQCGLA